MDPLKNKYTYLQKALHRWKARRDIPFRKRFFVGYDLHGNTYWEFSPDGNMQRLRRKMEPFQKLFFKADYFSLVPPQWLLWLRRTRNSPPTLLELTEDQSRQATVKLRAEHADRNWRLEKQRQTEHFEAQLSDELHRAQTDGVLEIANENAESPDARGPAFDKTHEALNPWKEADANQKGSVEEAMVKPRK